MSDSRAPVPQSAGRARFERRVVIDATQCCCAGTMQMPEYFRVLSAFRTDWLDSLAVGGSGASRPRFLTAALQADFRRPSHQGEDLSLSLSVAKVGKRSVTVHVHGVVHRDERVWLREVLVAVEPGSLEPQLLTDEMAAAVRLYGAS